MKSCKMISLVAALTSMVLLFGLPGCVSASEQRVEEPTVPERQATTEEDAAVAGAVDQHAEEPSAENIEDQNVVAASLEDYTWEQLSRISEEIAAAGDEAAGIEVAKKYNLCTPDGKLDGTQVKSVTLTDDTQTTVQIIGFNHDDKTAGGKAGITFIFGDAIAEMPMNSSGANAGGWEASELRAYLNSDGMNMLPQELIEIIGAVDKVTNNVEATRDTPSVSVTSDMLWLPSYAELGGVMYDDEDIRNEEGSEYKLYRDNEGALPVDFKDLFERTYDGEGCSWWQRSPESESTCGLVSEEGETSYQGGDQYPQGVVPGFCI